ncbi:MAG: hypothetical protein GY696_14675 [Gammaproteobacteria bacterium]|nr:hypothetical protein [Gammaproteobacteria bacterium]
MMNDREHAERLMGVLWSSAMSKGKMAQADKILAEFPAAYKRVRLGDLCVKGKEMESVSMEYIDHYYTRH